MLQIKAALRDGLWKTFVSSKSLFNRTGLSFNEKNIPLYLEFAEEKASELNTDQGIHVLASFETSIGSIFLSLIPAIIN